MASEFRYQRRVQFAETDLAGIVHFSTMFRYIEEAEHAMWRACGLSIAERDGHLGWPRLRAALEFRSPLRFEEEFEVLVRITAVVLALKAGKGLVVLPAVQLATGLLRMGTIMVVSRRLYPELHFLRTGWQRSHLRQILSHSFHTALQRAANLFNEQFNTVIVGWFLPIASVTFFTIGASLTSYARSAVDAIAHTVTPRISALEGGGDTQNMRLLPLVAGRVATMILLPIVFTFIFRGSTFIGLWMGPEYAEVSGRILLILSFSLWFSGGRQIISASLLGLSRHRVLVPAVWAEAISNARSIWIARA